MGRLKAPPQSPDELPTEGEHKATFKRFEDLGKVEEIWDGETRLRWKMNMFFDIDGMEQVYEVWPSLNQNSRFYEVIRALEGKEPPTDMETNDYLPTLIGKQVIVTIKRYGNVMAVIKSDNPAIPAVREMTATGKTNASKNAHGTVVTDADVPF